AVNREAAARAISKLSGRKKILILALSLFCLLKTNYDVNTLIGCVVDYIRGVGALGLIALALGSKQFASALNHRILVWLGRISYSLYLVHIPILYVVSQTIGKTWPGLEISLAVILLSLLIAEII